MRKQRNSMLKYLLLGKTLVILLSCMPMWVALGTTQVIFKPPRIPSPQRTEGGATRGNNCLLNHSASATDLVTPLVPSSGIGTTIKDRPGVLVYIPQITAKKALFSVQDERGTNLYQTTINLPRQPGVMIIKLPDSAPALKIGKNYKWSLVMMCSAALVMNNPAQLEPDSPWVSAWIQRVKPPVSLKSQDMSPSLKLVSSLAQSGVWYDTIFEFARLRQAQPHNRTITGSWQHLLNSVGLSAISNAPLTNISSLPNYQTNVD
jgi:hypothetical protein